MAGKRKRFDISAPGARERAAEIRRNVFLNEGTMIAFPTCLPGVTVPLPADESRITAMDLGNDGIVYAGTSGRRSHLLAGVFHGVSGVVFDMGVVEDAHNCAAVCACKDRVVACVNDAGAGRVILAKRQPIPDDLLQEWDIGRKGMTDLGSAVAGERIVHAVAVGAGEHVVGATARHLFMVDIASEKIEVVGEMEGSGQLAVGSRGGVFGRDGKQHLWRYDPVARRLDRRAVELPAGNWGDVDLRWARVRAGRHGYTADGAGNLFSFDENEGFSAALGQAMVTPVESLASTHDGRVFGFCGEGISRMFCYDPEDRRVRDLGVAVSVIERRRYGYAFGDAVTGRDGQIFFGEDDDLGHVWMYFPKIKETDS